MTPSMQRIIRKLACGVLIILVSLGAGIVSVQAADKPYIGMQLQELPPEAIVALGLRGEKFVMVRDVGRNTPAGLAGIRPGDLVLSFAGSDVSSLSGLVRLMGDVEPGDAVDVTLRRAGDTIETTIHTTLWPESQSLQKAAVGQVPAIGVTLVGLTREIRGQFGIRWDAQGLLVSLVDPSKGVSEIIQRGDVIVQVNQRDVWLPQQVIEIYAEAKAAGQRQILVLLERSDSNAMIMLPVK